MIPEPIDLPPRSRTAWRALVAQLESLQAQMDRATGRSVNTVAAVGATQASPYVDPNPAAVEEVSIPTQPPIPEGLVLTSEGAFAAGSGIPSAQITAAWTPGLDVQPDTGLQFADTASFEVWLRKVRTAPTYPSGDDPGVDAVNGDPIPPDPLDDSRRYLGTLYTSTDIRDLEFATQYAVKVRAVSPSGMMGDFTDEVLVTTVTAPADVLAAPNPPTLTTRLGTVTVTEAGLVGGGPVPGWLTDYVVEWNNATVWTVVGAIAPASSFIDTKLTVGTSREYRLRARDILGRLSDPSVSATIVVQGVVGPDIAANAVTANAIAAGAIDGMVITGAVVRTAASGKRVQMDTTGLRSYSSTEAVTAALTAEDGGLNLAGEFAVGAGTQTQVKLTTATPTTWPAVQTIPNAPRVELLSDGAAPGLVASLFSADSEISLPALRLQAPAKDLSTTPARIEMTHNRVSISTPDGLYVNGTPIGGSSALPALQTVSNNINETITATAWTGLPTPVSISLTLAAPAIVQVSLGGWLTASAGDTRCGVALSGATVQDALTVDGAAASWGATLYKATGGSSTEQQSFTRLYQCNAGTTVFDVQAYQSGGGTHQVNNPVLQVLPVRYV